jgi:hypothetical protein
LTASLSGPDAPDIRPEEVFEVNGGFIEVKPINLVSVNRNKIGLLILLSVK